MATVISLAAGVVVLALLILELAQTGDWIDDMRELIQNDVGVYASVFKAAGIAVLSELGAQLCVDAREKALAGRIALASRVAMLTLCAPMVVEMMELLDGLLP